MLAGLRLCLHTDYPHYMSVLRLYTHIAAHSTLVARMTALAHNSIRAPFDVCWCPRSSSLLQLKLSVAARLRFMYVGVRALALVCLY